MGLSADSARLSKDLDKARNRTKRFAKGVSADFKRVAQGIAAALSFRALRNFTAGLDDIAKSSRNVGLSAENFQLFTASLNEVGVETSVANKGLLTLQKAIGESARGTKTYSDALDALNLSQERLAGLDTQEQFLAVVDALGQVTDRTRRTQIGNTLLGRSYQKLGTAIQGGSKELLAIQSRMRELGVIVSDEAVASAELFNDRFAQLGLQLRAVASGALLPVIDGFSKLAITITEFNAAHPIISRLIVSLIGISVALALVSVAASVAATAWGVLAGVFGLLLSPIVLVSAAVIGIGVAIFKFRDDTVIALGDAVGFIYRQFLNIKTIFTTVVQQPLRVLTYLFKTAFLQIEQIAYDAVNAVTSALISFVPDSILPDFVRDADKNLSRLSNKIQTSQDELAAGVSDIGESITEGFRANAIAAEEFADTATFAIDNVLTNVDNIIAETGAKIEEFFGLTAETEMMTNQMKVDDFKASEEAKTAIAASEMAKRQTALVAQGFFTLTTEKQFGDQSLQVKGKNARADLAQLAKSSKTAFETQKAIAISETTINTYRAAQSAYTSLAAIPIVGPALGAVAAGLAIAAGFSRISSIKSQQFNPPRQLGGPVSSGRPGLVGENGPEVFVPDVSGEIIPNEEDGGPGQGNTTIQNITVQASNLDELLNGLNEMAINRSGQGFTGREVYSV